MSFGDLMSIWRLVGAFVRIRIVEDLQDWDDALHRWGRTHMDGYG